MQDYSYISRRSRTAEENVGFWSRSAPTRMRILRELLDYRKNLGCIRAYRTVKLLTEVLVTLVWNLRGV